MRAAIREASVEGRPWSLSERRTAAEDLCPRLFRDVAAPHHLLLAFDGTGAGDDGEFPAADRDVPDPDDRVVFLELPAGKLVGFEDRNDLFHAGKGNRRFELDLSPFVSDGADEGPLHAPGEVGLVADGGDPFGHMVDLFLRCVFFHQNNHVPPRSK
jgi:hypothetical protein